MSEVKRRLEAFIAYLGISTRAFERDAHVAVGFVRSIRQSISPAKQKLIQNAYPDLNIGWLLTGEGEMFRGPTPVHQTMTESPNSVQIAHSSAESVNINNKTEQGMEEAFMQKIVDRLMGSNEALVASNSELTRTNSRLTEEIASIRVTLEQQAAKMREMESALGCLSTHASENTKSVG